MQTVRATVNYWDPALPRGRMDTLDSGLNRMGYEAHEIEIKDMRTAAEKMSRHRKHATAGKCEHNHNVSERHKKPWQHCA